MTRKLARAVAPALLALAFAGAAGPAMSQETSPQPGDPPRWYRADVTPQDRYRTSIKEAGAALKEALDECRARPRSEARPSCEREARGQYRDDVAFARGRLAQELAAHG